MSLSLTVSLTNSANVNDPLMEQGTAKCSTHGWHVGLAPKYNTNLKNFRGKNALAYFTLLPVTKSKNL
jgi:hypothetical protein